MQTYYVNSAEGNEANAGTSPEAAWRYPPGMTGSTHTADVVSGDVVEIENGSSYTGRRLIPVGGVTYQGRGLGGTQIVLKKVVKGAPFLTYDYNVAREPGVHQGSWALLTGTLGSAAVLRFDNSGASVADVVIDGAPVGTVRDTVQMGNSPSVTSATLLRACVLNSSKFGIRARALNVTVREVQVLSSEQGCLRVDTELPGQGDGGAYIGTDLDLRNPQTTRNGTPSSLLGDPYQGYPLDGEWLRTMFMDGVYIYKIDQDKQALVFHDALNGFEIRNVHVYGSPTGNSTIDCGSIRGPVLLEDFYFYEGCRSFHIMRLNPLVQNPAPQLLAPNGFITMRRILVDGSTGGFSGMLTLASSNEPSGALDGRVVVESCIAIGPNEGEAFVTLWRSTMKPTVGALRATIRNNLSFMSGSQAHIVLPPDSALPNGAADRKNYRTTNNFFPSSASFNIGSTNYASVALFEAADAYATGNDDSHTWAEMLVDETTWGFSSVASPALVAGIWQPYSQAPRQLG